MSQANLSLADYKQLASEMDLPDSWVQNYGPLNRKDTWDKAIRAYEAARANEAFKKHSAPVNLLGVAIVGLFEAVGSLLGGNRS